MLKQLSIKHYALIEHLEIAFDKGLNILTGETGSGKSIILGALGLLVGERAESRAVAPGKKKCIVEATFQLNEKRFKKLFDKYDIDFDAQTLVRREILSSGKSRAFVNDTPVKLNVLRALGDRLLDIHSQHQTIQINDPKFQLEVIDRNAGVSKEIEVYHSAFDSWRRAVDELEVLRQKVREAKNEREFIGFQLQELKNADLDKIDGEALEEEYNKLAHAEEISDNLNQVAEILSNSDNPVLTLLRMARDRMSRLAGYGKSFEEISERLNSALIEVDDLAGEVDRLTEDVDADPARLENLERTRSAVFRLEQKHHVEGVAGLIALRNNLQERFSDVDTLDERIAGLEKTVTGNLHRVMDAGKKLSDKRNAGLNGFSKRVETLLHSLNMKAARFEIELQPLETPTRRGLDKVEMRFSANAGRKPESLRHVASGGELSRLMLAIKNIGAARSGDKTLLFDEIDTGVSGEVAHAMGKILKEMGHANQVICITHLPQIASKGETHFKVYKDKAGGVEATHIKKLSADQRIDEIAQMLSGANTTAAALENARELLHNN